MNVDAKNSLEAFSSVMAFLLLGWIGLGLARMLNGPNWLVVIGTGLFGVINLVVIVRGLWLRRASNPENPNHD